MKWGTIWVKEGIVLGICSLFPSPRVSLRDPHELVLKGVNAQTLSLSLSISERTRLSGFFVPAGSFKTESWLFLGFLEVLKYQIKN